MHPDARSKYESLRLPRYTSYPTALDFSPSVDASTYDGWLRALPAGVDGSLYLHVPFCAELCLYCGCHTSVARRYQPVASYCDLLEKEIAAIAERAGQALIVRRAHWGGGSPTILKPDDFHRLMAALRRGFTFADDAEIAIEIDPRTMTEPLAYALGREQLTRASLGVQTFDPLVQQTIRRVQSYEDTARVVEWLRAAGVGGINVDLMYGLPHQTAANVVASTQRTLTLDPDRISLFGYAHVPWMKRHQALLPERALPGQAERLRQFDEAAALIASAGYRRIGFDHFAKPTDSLAQADAGLRRNFQGYTTDNAPALIGLGASAISSLPQGYAQNAASVAQYRRAIEGGGLPTARGVALTAEDRIRRDVISEIMCRLTVDLNEICRAHGAGLDMFADDVARLKPLQEDGVAQIEGTRVTVPEDARHLVRAVGAIFDSRLSRPDRHSSVA